ncbi:hypothetical protein pdam_00024551 [Pocillopora damicornis]|uniref:Uncharacterized protein n=1 Tax=Pocillopora damicornis TaxID=46731 RepID=A0A3M6USW5_POCDA|nr:hypothetical protein pdam_00024551 [Pocillopora damicornis]
MAVRDIGVLATSQSQCWTLDMGQSSSSLLQEALTCYIEPITLIWVSLERSFPLAEVKDLFQSKRDQNGGSAAITCHIVASGGSWRAATYASTFGSLLMLCESSTSMEDGTSRSCGVVSSSVEGWSGTASAFAKEDEATCREAEVDIPGLEVDTNIFELAYQLRSLSWHAVVNITYSEDGKRRGVDDYHPRARLKQAHKKNEINIEDSASVQTFSNRYIVEESLVRKYLAHLNHLEMMSGKRKMEKKNKNLKENTMSYEEFDWMEMLNSGTLAKQRVCLLDKYIDKHNLLAVKVICESTKTNKQCSLSVEEVDDHDECEVDEGDEASPTCSSDEDFVLGEIGESSDQSDS